MNIAEKEVYREKMYAFVLFLKMIWGVVGGKTK